MIARHQTSIIVPVHNRADLTARFLKDFHQYCLTTNHQLIIVDDASTDKTQVLLQMWDAFGVWNVHNEQNQGFSKTCNRGANCALGDVLIFVNNDVVISGDFVTILTDAVRAKPYTMFGPQLYAWDTGWNRFGQIIVPYLGGWCFALHVDMWNALGGLDERYSPFDVEDMDLSWAAVQAGYHIQEIGLPIQHISGQSFTPDMGRRAITERNIQKFREKWNMGLT